MGTYFCKQISPFRLDNRDVQGRNEVARLDGAWYKKNVWHAHVPTWGLSETNVSYCFEKSVWDILVTFWPPQWFGAHGIVAPFPPWLRFWCYAKNRKIFRKQNNFQVRWSWTSIPWTSAIFEHKWLPHGSCTDCQQRLLAAFQVSSCRFVSLLYLPHAFFRRGLVPVLQVIKLFQHQKVYFFEVR